MGDKGIPSTTSASPLMSTMSSLRAAHRYTRPPAASRAQYAATDIFSGTSGSLAEMPVPEALTTASVSNPPRLLFVDAIDVTQPDPAALEQHPAVCGLVAQGAHVRAAEHRITSDGAQIMVVLAYDSDGDPHPAA